MNTTDFDTIRADAFTGRIAGMLDAGAAAAMISLGHRLGLFDTLAGLPRPATSAELAEATALSERYVRE